MTPNKTLIDTKKFFFVVTFFLFTCLFGFSQSPADSIAARQYQSKAQKFSEQTSFDSAIHYYKKASDSFASAQKWRMQAHCLNKLSEIYFSVSNYEEASASAEHALDIASTRIQGENEQMATALYNLGRTWINRGEYDKSIAFHQKALQIRKYLFGENDKSVVDSYLALGISISYKNDYHQALEHYQKALSIAGTIFSRHDPMIPNINTTIGIIYFRLGEFEKALRYFKNSVAAYTDPLFTGSIRDKEAGLSRTYNYMGSANFDLGNPKEALTFLNKSFEIIQRLYGDRSPQAIGYYRQIGDIHQALNNFTISESFYKKALNIATDIFGDKHPAHVTIYTNMAMLHSENGRYESALEYMHKSIVANAPSFNDSDPYSLPRSNADFQDYMVLFMSLNEKTNLMRKIYARTGELRVLKETLRTCQLTDTLLTEARRDHLNYNDKAVLGMYAIRNYEDAINVSLKLHEVTQDQKFLDYAFYFCSSNKAGIMREALLDMAAKGKGLIPENLLDLEQSVREEQIELRSKILHGQESNDPQIEDHKNRLFVLNRSVDSLMLHLEAEYPNYYSYKYKNDLPDIASIQQKLKPGTLLLEFFEGNNDTFIFAATAEQFKSFSIRNDSIYTNLVNQFRSDILAGATSGGYTKANFTQFCSSSSALYQLLLNQALTEIQAKEKINALLVIPDGLLAYIPFDLLLTKPASLTTSDFSKLPYVLNDYSVSYGYSAGLSLNNGADTSQPNSNYIAFAPQYETNTSIAARADAKFRNAISSLKWNQEEVKYLSEKADGESYTAHEATEKYFKNKASSFGVIHLAMHALVDEDDPMNSSLVFAADNDSTEDGFLHAFELYNMKLNAQMAVLSACNTGYGKIVKGEGVMSLARAFSYAGVPSVVMSHWRVDDEATSILMQYFYNNLTAGMTKAEALRQAKLTYLAETDPTKSHPFFWGAFLSIGNDTPVSIDKNRTPLYIGVAVIIIILLLAILIVARVRRARS